MSRIKYIECNKYLIKMLNRLNFKRFIHADTWWKNCFFQ